FQGGLDALEPDLAGARALCLVPDRYRFKSARGAVLDGVGGMPAIGPRAGDVDPDIVHGRGAPRRRMATSAQRSKLSSDMRSHSTARCGPRGRAAHAHPRSNGSISISHWRVPPGLAATLPPGRKDRMN